MSACEGGEGVPVFGGGDEADGGEGDGDDDDDGPVTSPTTAERYAVARCAARERCECEYDPFGSITSCEQIMAAAFRQLQISVGEAELDLQCFERVLDAFEADECETPSEVAALALAPACFVYRGAGESGDSCWTSPGVLTTADSCTEGMSCQSTPAGPRCRDEKAPPMTIDEGDACGSGQTPQDGCGDGLYCAPQSLTCAFQRRVGQSCDSLSACVEGTWCKGDFHSGQGVCTLQVEEGESCADPQACAPAMCDTGVCTPGVCVTGECAPAQALVCLPSEV